MIDQLNKFQARVSELAGADYLKFILDIWDPNSQEKEKSSNKRLTINRTLVFPYLDMEFYWQKQKKQKLCVSNS